MRCKILPELYDFLTVRIVFSFLVQSTEFFSWSLMRFNDSGVFPGERLVAPSFIRVLFFLRCMDFEMGLDR